MSKNLIERKKKLLEDIADCYNYTLMFKADKVIMDSYISEYFFEYKNIDEALKDWLSTLEASNKDREDEGFGEYDDWSKEVIGFIKEL